MDKSSNKGDMKGLLVGIGNPLLDISAIVDEELLKKYDLHPDDAIMAEEKHMPLYKELMEKYNAEFIAGGSVQNSLRVAQWILGTPDVCTYLGCVGDDNYAKILKERADITNKPSIPKRFFRITVNSQVALNMLTCLLHVYHLYINIFVSNLGHEAEAFAKAFNIPGDNSEQIAKNIATLPKLNSTKPRVVVITQGSDPVILVEGNKVTLIPVRKLDKEQIVDTNGAGDAFTGGFLSQLVLDCHKMAAIVCPLCQNPLVRPDVSSIGERFADML
ncbi:Adenosine kinase 1 [Papilio machaon]|uniref:Adenosine kinase n=1 Tax=Papilio machaon TaxID=76193 RepID=A0A194R5Q8_PAPMA|nr:Adenosine kinase 1 [Papilio machaon]